MPVVIRSNKYIGFFIFLPFILTVLNSLLFMDDRIGFLAIIKGLTISTVVVTGYVFYLRKTQITSIIFILAVYWLLLIPFSSSINISIWFYFKVILSIALIPLGISLSNSNKTETLLFKMTLGVLLFTIAFAIIANIFDIGINQYSSYKDDITVGLADAQLYTPALASVFMFYILETVKLAKRNQILIYILILLTFIVLLISMRRTAVLIVIIGIFQYFYFSKRITKNIKVLVVGALLLLAMFPLYNEFLFQRYELRSSKISFEYSLKEEHRYRETFLLLSDIKESSSIVRTLFGKEIFNSAYNYGNSVFGKRILHIDFNQILFGSGVIGLFIYILLYNKLFKLNNRNNKLNLNKRAIVSTMLILSLFISLSGQMYEVSFRSYIFITIGILIGQNKKLNPK